MTVCKCKGLGHSERQDEKKQRQAYLCCCHTIAIIVVFFLSLSLLLLFLAFPLYAYFDCHVFFCLHFYIRQIENLLCLKDSIKYFRSCIG